MVISYAVKGMIAFLVGLLFGRINPVAGVVAAICTFLGAEALHFLTWPFFR